jgi:hypothetical protein
MLDALVLPLVLHRFHYDYVGVVVLVDRLGAVVT